MVWAGVAAGVGWLLIPISWRRPRRIAVAASATTTSAHCSCALVTMLSAQDFTLLTALHAERDRYSEQSNASSEKVTLGVVVSDKNGISGSA